MYLLRSQQIFKPLYVLFFLLVGVLSAHAQTAQSSYNLSVLTPQAREILRNDVIDLLKTGAPDDLVDAIAEKVKSDPRSAQFFTDALSKPELKLSTLARSVSEGLLAGADLIASSGKKTDQDIALTAMGFALGAANLAVQLNQEEAVAAIITGAGDDPAALQQAITDGLLARPDLAQAAAMYASQTRGLLGDALVKGLAQAAEALSQNPLDAEVATRVQLAAADARAGFDNVAARDAVEALMADPTLSPDRLRQSLSDLMAANPLAITHAEQAFGNASHATQIGYDQGTRTDLEQEARLEALWEGLREAGVGGRNEGNLVAARVALLDRSSDDAASKTARLTDLLVTHPGAAGRLTGFNPETAKIRLAALDAASKELPAQTPLYDTAFSNIFGQSLQVARWTNSSVEQIVSDALAYPRWETTIGTAVVDVAKGLFYPDIQNAADYAASMRRMAAGNSAPQLLASFTEAANAADRRVSLISAYVSLADEQEQGALSGRDIARQIADIAMTEADVREMAGVLGFGASQSQRLQTAAAMEEAALLADAALRPTLQQAALNLRIAYKIEDLSGRATALAARPGDDIYGDLSGLLAEAMSDPELQQMMPRYAAELAAMAADAVYAFGGEDGLTPQQVGMLDALEKLTEDFAGSNPDLSQDIALIRARLELRALLASDPVSTASLSNTVLTQQPAGSLPSDGVIVPVPADAAALRQLIRSTLGEPVSPI